MTGRAPWFAALLDAPPAPAPVTIADLLSRAADLIEEFGWRQFAVGSKAQGAFCARGAINEAGRDLGVCPPGRLPSPRPLLLEEAQRTFMEHLGIATAHWNDARGRAKAEVVAELRRAANSQSAPRP